MGRTRRARRLVLMTPARCAKSTRRSRVAPVARRGSFRVTPFASRVSRHSWRAAWCSKASPMSSSPARVAVSSGAGQLRRRCVVVLDSPSPRAGSAPWSATSVHRCAGPALRAGDDSADAALVNTVSRSIERCCGAADLNRSQRHVPAASRCCGRRRIRALQFLAIAEMVCAGPRRRADAAGERGTAWRSPPAPRRRSSDRARRLDGETYFGGGEAPFEQPSPRGDAGPGRRPARQPDFRRQYPDQRRLRSRARRLAHGTASRTTKTPPGYVADATWVYGWFGQDLIEMLPPCAGRSPTSSRSDGYLRAT